MTNHTREIAERVFRKEHPRLFPFSPYERQMELRDLWPADQEDYVQRVELVLAEAANDAG